MSVGDFVGQEFPPAAASVFRSHGHRLAELGVSGVTLFRGPNGDVQLTFLYSSGGPPDATTFNGREAERVRLLDLLRPLLAESLPPDGTPRVVAVC